MVSTTAAVVADEYPGTDWLIFEIVLAVFTFRHFAQTTLRAHDLPDVGDGRNQQHKACLGWFISVSRPCFEGGHWN